MLNGNPSAPPNEYGWDKDETVNAFNIGWVNITLITLGALQANQIKLRGRTFWVCLFNVLLWMCFFFCHLWYVFSCRHVYRPFHLFTISILLLLTIFCSFSISCSSHNGLCWFSFVIISLFLLPLPLSVHSQVVLAESTRGSSTATWWKITIGLKGLSKMTPPPSWWNLASHCSRSSTWWVCTCTGTCTGTVWNVRLPQRYLPFFLHYSVCVLFPSDLFSNQEEHSVVSALHCSALAGQKPLRPKKLQALRPRVPMTTICTNLVSLSDSFISRAGPCAPKFDVFTILTAITVMGLLVGVFSSFPRNEMQPCPSVWYETRSMSGHLSTSLNIKLLSSDGRYEELWDHWKSRRN